jgi:hypothetical protein
VLSGLAAVAAITAVAAGVAGAWSPCGFSVIETIGSALGDPRRTVTALATVTFTVGALAGGVVTFGGLALIGGLAGSGAAGLREALACALALAAAIADWRGVRLAPQIRRQLPERWRWTMPLPLASILYGLLLGLGFTTFVLSFAVWALAGLSVAAGSAGLGVAVGLGFGLGRALPVLWIAPRLGSAAGERALERLALEPRMWLGIRRLDALGMAICAALLAALLGTASATAAPIAGATDPSVDGAVLAWQRVGGTGMLRRPSGTGPVAGTLPAVGGFNTAWLTPTGIAVQLRHQPPLTLPLPPNAEVTALAISGSWLVVRDQGTTGVANLFAVSLSALAQGGYVATYIRGSGTPGAIGRPTIEGTLVAYSYSTPARSSVEAMDLASGARTVLRSATSEVQFANPSLASGHLLYVRTDRCAQELLLGGTYSSTADRVLLTLPSTVARDPGWQSGYQHAWNNASGCPNRGPGPGGTMTLSSTALGSTDAYVSESPPNLAQTSIVTVPLG